MVSWGIGIAAAAEAVSRINRHNAPKVIYTPLFLKLSFEQMPKPFFLFSPSTSLPQSYFFSLGCIVYSIWT